MQRVDITCEGSCEGGVSREAPDKVNEDASNEVEVKPLNNSLTQTPNTNYIELIDKVRNAGESDRLRVAKEKMKNIYPFDRGQWRYWINVVDIKLEATQKKEVLMQCKRGLQNYSSMEEWLKFLFFSIDNALTDKNAIKSTYQLFERALTTIELVTIEGSIIWMILREFQLDMLALVEGTHAAKKKEQLDKMDNFFRWQMSYRLYDIHKRAEKYALDGIDDGAKAAIDYKDILQEPEQTEWKTFHEQQLILAQNESEKLDAYKGYLLDEKQQGDSGQVTLLYERAIIDLPMEVTIWLDYINYLEENVNIESILDQVYQRASTNIPRCPKVWQKWMRSYEKWERPELEIQKLLENALSSDFSTADDYRILWITYLEYLRRKKDEVEEESEEGERRLDVLNNMFNKAYEYLEQHFGLDGDPNCIILQYWARTLADACNHVTDMIKPRALWDTILSKKHSTEASYWLKYIVQGRMLGGMVDIRRLFHRGLDLTEDRPERVANAWIDYEREEASTLEQMEYCEARTKERLDKVAEERQLAQQISAESELSAPSKKASKRILNNTDKWENLVCSPSKIMKHDVQLKTKLEDNRLNIDVEAGGNQAKSGSKVAPPPSFKKLLDEIVKVDEDDQREVENSITGSVSNLDHITTEEQVRDTLKAAGPITLFKMVKDYKEAVEEASKLDITAIKGRRMFTSRCDPNKCTRSLRRFKYRSTFEKNKLLIKGLPLTTTKEELENIFKVHGPMRMVHLHTYHDGQSMGRAYVEYYDEANAAKALLSTDGMKINDKVISVAIIQPLDRKKTQTAEDNSGRQVQSLGGTTSGHIAKFGDLDRHLPYKEEFMSAHKENEQPDAFKGYLLHRVQYADPGRLRIMYEKAILKNNLDVTIWLDYIDYLEEHFKSESFLNSVYQRASKNIPSCTKVWQKWIRSYERWKKPVLEVEKLVQTALSSVNLIADDHRNLWLAYLEYLRRNLLKKCEERNIPDEEMLEKRATAGDLLFNAFEKACLHLVKYFGLDGDPNCIIMRYWAKCELGMNEEMSRNNFKALWINILSQGHYETASYWLEFITLTYSLWGENENVRQLCQAALTYVKDSPESIAEAWIDFERDNGTLKQLEFCETKTEEKLAKVAEERQLAQRISAESEL